MNTPTNSEALPLTNCSPSTFSVYDTHHPIHQPYTQPLFEWKQSQDTTVKAITNNTQSQREVTPESSLGDSSKTETKGYDLPWIDFTE